MKVKCEQPEALVTSFLFFLMKKNGATVRLSMIVMLIAGGSGEEFLAVNAGKTTDYTSYCSQLRRVL